MPKQKKRRLVDYSTTEMVKLCGMKASSTFENKRDKVFERYEIDSSLFKMDPNIENGGENFYPVICAELLAILIRNWDKNPSSRKNANRDNVTVTQICDYYRALLKDVDNLPKELRGLIYKSCQSHFTTKCLVIWAERLVNGLALFTETYLDQQKENIGKLCQSLAINLDKMTYMEYMNNKLIEAIPWITQFGVILNPFNMNSMQKPTIDTQNVGLDVGLAELIKAIALKMNNDKEEIQYESIKENVSDVNTARGEYYKMVQAWYISSEQEEYTTNTYSQGALAWKNWAKKIETGEMEGKDAIVAFYEKQLADARLEVMALEQRLEAIKKDNPSIFPVTVEELEDINDTYVEYFNDKYGKQTSNQRYADVYIGQMLWSFLTQDSN
ncbi:MAG: hypothetical protein IJN64_14905 [Lachnospiraceae bacterium]|nr:hypothetical protein [Lachnospiraceae bacterium]